MIISKGLKAQLIFSFKQHSCSKTMIRPLLLALVSYSSASWMISMIHLSMREGSVCDFELAFLILHHMIAFNPANNTIASIVPEQRIDPMVPGILPSTDAV